jgi:hypothetical protein
LASCHAPKGSNRIRLEDRVLRHPPLVARTLLQRIHNPRNSVCGCDADCWCRTTRSGRLVKWWFPAHRFGIRHKNTWFDTTFKSWTDDQIRAWKREQEHRGPSPTDGSA